MCLCDLASPVQSSTLGIMTYHIHPRQRRSSNVPLALLGTFTLLLVSTLVLRTASHLFITTKNFIPAPKQSTQKTDGLLVITVVNWMYHEFLANFACNLRNLGVKAGPVVYSLDRRTAEFAGVLGLSTVLLADEEGADAKPGQFDRYGPRSFNSITKKKVEAVRITLKAGLDVLLSDADVFWCKDAAVVLRELTRPGNEYEDADVVVKAEGGYRSLNSGFYYVRAGKRSVRLFEHLVKNIEFGAHDQDLVNEVFCGEEFGGRRIEEPYAGVPYYCESHGAIIRLLPSAEFPSGAELYGLVNVFKKSRAELKRMCRSGIVVIHNNFIRASKKKARFIQKGMWLVRFEGEQPVCLSEPVPGSPTTKRTCGTYC